MPRGQFGKLDRSGQFGKLDRSVTDRRPNCTTRRYCRRHDAHVR
jgi:hypothetical protein